MNNEQEIIRAIQKEKSIFFEEQEFSINKKTTILHRALHLGKFSLSKDLINYGYAEKIKDNTIKDFLSQYDRPDILELLEGKINLLFCNGELLKCAAEHRQYESLIYLLNKIQEVNHPTTLCCLEICLDQVREYSDLADNYELYALFEDKVSPQIRNTFINQERFHKDIIQDGNEHKDNINILIHRFYLDYFILPSKSNNLKIHTTSKIKI